MSVLELAQARLGDALKKESAHSWAGPCPGCGGTDRFVVKKDGHEFFCRGCGAQGDAVTFRRLFDKLACPDAHEVEGVRCESTTCPAAERCRAHRDHRAGGPRPSRPARVLAPPAPDAAAAPFTPAEARPPEQLWAERAAKLVEHAHQALLEAPEPLAWLARRGLPRGAVERYRLGWLAADAWRPRAAWGLPADLRPDGTPKKLCLPAGLVLPFFDAAGVPIRLRIRKRDVQEGQPRYYWVPGSGDDVPVLGPESNAFVVVESDLDGFLVHWHAADLVGVIPLGTCSAHPKAAASAVLSRAKAVIVSLDADAAGAKASLWWLQRYQRAVRWPVPAGKDPGEFAEQGGNVRAWVVAGLPPALALSPAAAPPPAGPAERTAFAEPAKPEGPPVLRAVSKGGIPYVVAATREQFRELLQENPGAAAFTWDEIALLKGASPEEAHAVLLARQVFPDAPIIGRKALTA